MASSTRLKAFLEADCDRLTKLRQYIFSLEFGAY